MKIKELQDSSELTMFQKRCLGIKDHIGNDKDIQDYDLEAEQKRSIIKRAENIEHLIKLCMQEIPFSQATAELIRNKDIAWYFLRNQLRDNVFKTTSDAGSIKIGNGSFTILIGNDYGDGETRVAVVMEKDTFNSQLMNFKNSVEGIINIYDYDCGGGQVIKTITGKYGIYAYNGIVVFEKWE
jgi:hypothetical protein